MDELDRLWRQSGAMADLLGSARRLMQRIGAGAQLPSVLILGETGTGKTRLASALHRISPRKKGAYVDCRLESMPESLAESELFGYERGAFTGAHATRSGLFQSAHGGTLFLDEIGVASPALQVKLLKTVEERVVRRVGSTRPEPFDAWIISATNEDLVAAIKDRRFREDLYHRLAVVTLRLPPLRERGEDTLLLARHFLERTATDYGLVRMSFTQDAEQKILEHSWPGNVRELANTVERAALLSESAVIDADALDLRQHLAEGGQGGAPRAPESEGAGSEAAAVRGDPTPAPLTGTVRERVQHALEQHRWNISRAARALGISRNTLRANMQRLGLRPSPGGLAPRPGRPGMWSADPATALDGGGARQRSTPTTNDGGERVGSPAPTSADGEADLDAAPAEPSRPSVEAELRPQSTRAFAERDPSTRVESGTLSFAGEGVHSRQLAWERQLIAFLMVSLDPPEGWIAAQIAPTLGEIIDKVEPFGGRIRHVRPQGLTALFGVEPLDDFPRRAANAAIAALKMIERAAAGPLETLSGRAALHVEECLVAHARGAVGIEPEHEHEAMTVLDKLIAEAPRGAAVVSDTAASLLERRFDLVPLEDHRRVFRLARHERSGLEVGGRRLSPFVGRAHELGTLDALLREAERGRGQIAGIVGDPGLGKTRLMGEFIRGAARARATVLTGGCVSYASHSPYHPLIEVLRQSLGLDDGEVGSPEALAETVRRGVTALDLDEQEVAPFLIHLLGGTVGVEHLAGWTPEAIRQRSVDAIRRLALAGSSRRPLVIVVEDLQWIDQSSEDTLASLADSLAMSALVLLTTYRPGYRPPWSGRSNLTQLALGPLTGDESRTLVRSVMVDQDLAGELSERILARAVGVPFFLEELARALADDPSLAAAAIPDTIQATLAARIGRLAPSDRALLQTASVLGKNVHRAVLSAVAGVIDAPLRDSLGRLEQAEFLYEAQPGSSVAYTFKHVLTQEVAYRSLPEEQRRVLHARAAEAIQRVTPDVAAQAPEILAHHAMRGGLTADAIGHWHRAGQRAIQRSANVEAIAHLTTGLRLVETLPAGPGRLRLELGLQLALSTALVAQKGFASDDVGQTLARVRALTDQLGDAAELVPVRFGLSRFSLARAEFDTSDEFGRQILVAAERHGDPQLLLVGHTNLGVTAFYRGRLADAERHLLEVQRLYDPARGAMQATVYGQDLGPTTLAYLGWIQVLRGAVDTGTATVETATEQARRGGHAFTLAHNLMCSGVVHSERRDASRVQHDGDEIVALTDRQGFLFFKAYAFYLPGYARFLAGERADGLDLLRQGHDLFRASRQRVGMRFRTLLAEALVERGELEPALDLLDALLVHAAETGEGGSLSEVYRVKADALWRRSPGDPEIEPLLSRAVEIAEAQGASYLGLRALCRLVGLHRERAVASTAVARLRDLYASFTEGLELEDLREARRLIDSAGS